MIDTLYALDCAWVELAETSQAPIACQATGLFVTGFIVFRDTLRSERRRQGVLNRYLVLTGSSL